MRRLAPLILLSAAACTVGPDYAGPPAAAPRAAAGAAFVRGADTVDAAPPRIGRWWTTLPDPVLDRLEERALAANPDLAAAAARVRQAGAILRERRANRLPKVSATAVYAHARIPGLDLQNSDGGSGGDNDTTDLNLYNLGFIASWEVDLFGGTRRGVEAARATAAVRQAQLADVQVSLTAQVADAYLNARERQRRIALTQAAIGSQEQTLALIREREAGGTASRIDVASIAQQLDDMRADAAPVAAELEGYLDALAVLTGDEPGTHDPLMRAAAPLPLPPASIAVGDPAALLRRRPDIRAAERTLAADTARIGEAVATRFPRLSFLGIIGIGGSRPTDLSKLDDFVAIGAPQLSWSLFDFGRSAARVEQSHAVRDESEAKYRSAVLAALRDAEDSLARFSAGRKAVGPLARALASAETTARLTRQRYDAGTTTLADALDAERRRLAAERNLVQAEARLTLSFVAVQKALGLGWADPAVTARNEGDQPNMR